MHIEQLDFAEGATNVDRAKTVIGTMKEIFKSEIDSEFSEKFGEMLDRGHHKYHAMGTLHSHMEKLRSARPDDVIRAVRLELHNYLAAFGISTAGFKIDFLAQDGSKLLLPKEKESPGMLFTPEMPRIYRPALLGLQSVFGGAEQITAVSEKITARGFLLGENMQRTQAVQQLRRGQSIIAPHGTMIGVRVQVVNRDKLNASHAPHAAILSDHSRHVPKDPDHRGEVIWHISLTREEALRLMEL